MLITFLNDKGTFYTKKIKDRLSSTFIKDLPYTLTVWAESGKADDFMGREREGR